MFNLFQTEKNRMKLNYCILLNSKFSCNYHYLGSNDYLYLY